MKPLLIGEANPYQTDRRMADRYALHPDPPLASGGRLCHFVMGLDEETYLRAFDRMDLCFPKWVMKAARVKAAQLLVERGPEDVIVLCGAKVAAAFSLPSTPFVVYAGDGLPTRVVIAHPSGLCRVWHEPDAVVRAREVLRRAGVLPQVSAAVAKVFGEPYGRAVYHDTLPAQYADMLGPVPLRLFCPKCGMQHIDVDDETGAWATTRHHRKHLCKPTHGGCGQVWQPFEYVTVGVE